jgi:pyrroline-5-carboxylate reductase
MEVHSAMDSDPGSDRTNATVALIGGGQMGLALAAGWVASGLKAPAEIMVYDPAPAARSRLMQRVPGIRTAESAVAAAAAADLVILAVKPQQAAEACREMAPGITDRTVVVSIVAGMSTESLAAATRTNRIVRVMPNTPALVGRGVSVLCHAPEVSSADAEIVRTLFRAVGQVHDTSEQHFDAVTALSGSGPGYVALFVEALADGGVRAGLPRSLAQSLAIETLAGTAALLLESGDHPAVVRDRVTSPGGTTMAGLAVLEQRAVRAAISDAIAAAATRSRELGRPS